MVFEMISENALIEMENSESTAITEDEQSYLDIIEHLNNVRNKIDEVFSRINTSKMSWCPVG